MEVKNLPINSLKFDSQIGDVHKEHVLYLFMGFLIHLLDFVESFKFSQIAEKVHKMDFIEAISSNCIEICVGFELMELILHKLFGLVVYHGDIVFIFRNISGFQINNHI
jgi:hypothetical protein